MGGLGGLLRRRPGRDASAVSVPLDRDPWRADLLRAELAGLYAALPEGGWPIVALGNHDRVRLATRLGPAQARVAAVLLLTLAATPCLLYGDELGLPDQSVPAERLRDYFAHTAGGVSRDPVRTPMPWEDGVIGLGSVFSSEALVLAALETLRPICLGADPREPDRISQVLHENTFWLGRGGAITHAISGIDIALWDILGQVSGLPISTLLGGRYRERVQPYASVLADEPPVLVDNLAGLTELGFTAFKIGWGGFGRVDAVVDEQIVAAAREAVGAGALLAVDAGGSDAFWRKGYAWAARTAEMLAEYDVAWFEEALRPDDLDGFVQLRRRSKVAISGGEVLTRRQEFTRFLAAGAFDIIQPDTTKGGGLSESRRVAWLAEEFGIGFVPHGWNTAIGLAADLQLAASLPATELVEYKTGSAYIDDIVDGGFTLDADGMLTVPSEPGLGVHLDLDALDRYATGHQLFDA